MNTIINFEDMVSCSRSKREGESSQDVCDRLDLTRDDSQRQLPTDHDYAVSTREYQLDQSSPLPASAAADPVFERQQQKQTPRIRAYIDRVTPYQRPLSFATRVCKCASADPLAGFPSTCHSLRPAATRSKYFHPTVKRLRTRFESAC